VHFFVSRSRSGVSSRAGKLRTPGANQTIRETLHFVRRDLECGRRKITRHAFWHNPILPQSREDAMSDRDSKAAEAATEFSTDIAALRADIAKISATVMELVREKTTNRVLDAVGDARQTISDKATEAQDKVNSMSAELEATIERNPLVAVFLAALAGFIVGTLSRPHK
jgi:ElaB/YqjD/DUF883 family membrane-anchored ribosome-binding protein